MSITTRAEFAWGADVTADPATWSWTDESSRLLGSVSVTFGRSDEASTTQPATCSLRLGNTDSRLSPRHVGSPLFPYVRRQVPVRVSLNPGTGFVQQFEGQVDQITPVWPSGNSEYAEVNVTASGTSQRLNQDDQPLRSAMYRAVSAASTQPSAYWALEDGSRSAQGRPGGLGATPMAMSGVVNFGSATGAPGSDMQVTFAAGGALIGAVPGAGSVTSWRIQCAVRCNAISSPDFAVPLEWNTFDGNGWELTADALIDGGLTYSDTLGNTFSSGVAIDDGQWHEIRATAVQSGGNIVLTVALDGATVISQTFAGTVSRITQVFSNRAASTSNVISGVGHIIVWNGTTSIAGLDTVDALKGHSGERASDRMIRLCAEEGVPLSVSATTDTLRMGPQGLSTLMALLRECEAVDGGILYDGAGPGLTYLTRPDRYNLAVSMALDCVRHQVKLPFSPTEDDQRVRNDITANRPGGNSARFVDEAHVAANGRYGPPVTANVPSDDDLLGQASWRVHLGTVEEMRVSSLSLELIDHPELWAAWLATTIGERLTATNLPKQYPPGTLDMVLEGYTETWDATSWRVTANTSPYAPWRIAVLATDTGDIGAFVERLDTDDTVTGAAAAIGATSLSLLTRSGPYWTMASDDFTPALQLDVNGTKVAVTNIVRTVFDNFGRTSASGWSTADSGQTWTTTGTTSVSSNTGIHTCSTAGTFVISAINTGVTDHDFYADVSIPVGNPSGASISQWVCVRYTNSSNFYGARLDILTNGAINLWLLKQVGGTTTGIVIVPVAITHASGDLWRIGASAVGSTIKVKAWLKATQSEPDWMATATDTSLTTGTQAALISWPQSGNTNVPFNVTWDSVVMPSPQRATVDGSTVVRALPAGSTVTVWDPPVPGL